MDNHIITGKNNNYNVSYKSLGKYYLACLKNKNEDDIIMVDGLTGKTLTCKDLIQNGIKFARILNSMGLDKGDVVTVVSENNMNFSALILGTSCNGVILNPLNPAYLLNELKSALNLTRPKLIITTSGPLKHTQQAVSELDLQIKIIIMGEADAASSSLQSLENLLENTEADETNFKPVEFDIAEQGAVILLSSGTTGLPKAVLLSHLNVLLSHGYFGDPNYFNAALKTTVQVVPNNHVFGYLIQVQSIAIGLRIILFKKFLPEQFLSSIEKYKVDLLFAVPSILLFLVKSQLTEKYDLSSLRDMVVGAAPVGGELQNEAKLKFSNMTIREVYGATEVSGPTNVQTPSRYKSGSCGILVPDLTAKVIDATSNKALGPGELGELCFKGPQVMLGYIRNSAETEASFDKDGFYHTGDLGYYDEDHFFFIIDRIKELIKYKGYQVPPAELETLLLSNPKIKDCGVVGIPDERAGQVPLAFVVKQPNVTLTEEEVINFVAERISVQKHLYGGVRFVEEIPRNTNGKVVRKELSKLLSQ